MISSLSFLHSLEHPKRVTEWSREEEEVGDRGVLGGGGRESKVDRAIKTVITLLSKNGY